VRHIVLSLAAAGAVFLAPAPLWAEDVYDCTAQHRGSDGWTPDRVIFFVDAEKQTARVLDGVTQYVEGGPIDAKLQKRSETAYNINWVVRNIPSRNEGALTAEFSAILRPEKGRFSVTATVRGYDNSPRSQGRCVLQP